MKIADCSRLIVVTVGCGEGLEFKYGGEVKGDECMLVERERERERKRVGMQERLISTIVDIF